MRGHRTVLDRLDDELTTDSEMVATVVVEMRRLAVNDTAPTVDQYSQLRQAGTPSHTAVLRRTGLSWGDLARKAGLRRSNDRRRHGQRDTETLPQFVDEELHGDRRCECGQPAVAIGRFVSLSGFDTEVANAMLLCRGCMALVDRNVRVELLAETNQP